ncbi:hypothetical protein SNOG_12514 [Parastagonospora nodorum SN15]|uniref:Uncharacterized protein n=2 Tax=Phaeosphaeria nodorum (strain SN15 / ATCC MYA-4574 / FGSC 10173) TaxID=321614 RepID=A0A7U2ICK0_PHANO|nr:hypothetical protein SNOG_12514 [Parastagonospora nodorum SN15]EAT80327.1 hypothetical protein SNOG_12514 [Parastagonospora nodorum SN15]QRD07329.1 hypothetical protein JI435_125140 [Parastagonospora nodorum SN15]
MVSLNSDRTTSPTFFHTHLRWYQQPKNPPPALRSSWYQKLELTGPAARPWSNNVVAQAVPATLSI